MTKTYEAKFDKVYSPHQKKLKPPSNESSDGGFLLLQTEKSLKENVSSCPNGPGELLFLFLKQSSPESVLPDLILMNRDKSTGKKLGQTLFKLFGTIPK